jgi:hypothetical protein
MRHVMLFLALAAAPATPVLQAQSSAPPPATPITCPTTATTDQLIAAIDTAISGPADKDRTCFRQLFLPDARLIPIRIAADGTATPRILAVQDWIDAVARRGSTIVIEKQINEKTETWAHLAHLWSTYETKIGEGPKTAGDRGINSIQAVYDGKQWHIQEIVWQAETPTDPVPEKYLP